MKDTTFHSYTFFQLNNSFRRMTSIKKNAYIKEFVQLVESNKKVVVYAYSLVGLKSDCDILLWLHASSIEEIQLLIVQILAIKMGEYLSLSHTLLGMTRGSQYNSKPVANNEELDGILRLPYLIVYPFTKTKEWYLLSKEKRMELMRGHMKVGFQYKHIRQLLLYSFGIDDPEFIVSYETDSLSDFQSLVMAMRETEVRLYTQNDTPIFTCVYKPADQLFKEI